MNNQCGSADYLGLGPGAETSILDRGSRTIGPVPSVCLIDKWDEKPGTLFCGLIERRTRAGGTARSPCSGRNDPHVVD